MNIYTPLLSYKKDHYLNRYIKLIEYYTENPPSVNYEVHHILPKSLFEHYKDNSDNLVKLPIKAHFIAHYLLHKIIGSKMTVAYYMMCNRLNKKTSKAYESARLYHSENMKGNSNPNHDGNQAKRAWSNSSPERRKKQKNIMKQVNKIKWSNPKNKQKLAERNKKSKSIICVFENIKTGEKIVTTIPDFSKLYNFSKSGLHAAKDKRLYKNEWVIKTHSDQLGDKDDQSPTNHAANATGS